MLKYENLKIYILFFRNYSFLCEEKKTINYFLAKNNYFSGGIVMNWLKKVKDEDNLRLIFNGILFLGFIIWFTIFGSLVTGKYATSLVHFFIRFMFMIIIFAIFSFVWAKSFYFCRDKLIEENNKIEQEKLKEFKLKRIDELKEEFPGIIKIINRQIKNIVGNFDPTKVSMEFLLKFVEFEDIYNCGFPDSFNQAACLLFAILECPVVKLEGEDQETKDAEDGINSSIAICSALELILEPTICFKYNDGKIRRDTWPKVKHPIPDGNVMNSVLGATILKRLEEEFYESKTYSINWYANMFRNIYFNADEA